MVFCSSTSGIHEVSVAQSVTRFCNSTVSFTSLSPTSMYQPAYAPVQSAGYYPGYAYGYNNGYGYGPASGYGPMVAPAFNPLAVPAYWHSDR